MLSASLIQLEYASKQWKSTFSYSPLVLWWPPLSHFRKKGFFSWPFLGFHIYFKIPIVSLTQKNGRSPWLALFCCSVARRHILSPVKTVRSNLHCKTTLQQNPVGRVTRWMPPSPLGQWKFGCSAPQDPVGRPPAHEGVIYAIYQESWVCIRDCKASLANRGIFRLWSRRNG